MKKQLAVIIEDNKILSQMFARALGDIHYQTMVIDDGRQALNWLQSGVPHLLLLDLHLPYISGSEILDQLLADARFENTFIVLVTADARMGSALAEKADFLLNKPVDLEQLQQLATRLKSVERKNGSQAITPRGSVI
ncbi:MAG: response regulator [Anaerolineales bacterium]|nr:response regulator [Anaerolineales bacterium]